MKKELLDFIEINPVTEPVATVIWLHGLGADGHDFEPIVPELRLPEGLALRFVFPHAPRRSVTINAGVVMRAWYDILDIGVSSRVSLDDFFDSVDHLEALIQHERQSGMPSDRIVLAGFSQGGAIALHTALTHEEKLAGVMALSTTLPTTDRLATERSPHNQDIPVIMAHGTGDPVIPIAKATQTRDELVGLGYAIGWHEYAMDHAVCPEEIDDIRAWFLKVLEPSHQD